MLRAGVGLQSVCFVAAALSLEVLGGEVGQGVMMVMIAYLGFKGVRISALRCSTSLSRLPSFPATTDRSLYATYRQIEAEKERERQNKRGKRQKEREREKDRPMYSQKG